MRFKAKFSRDIAGILPFLNRRLKSGQYNDQAKTLTYNQGIMMITIQRDTLAVAKIVNESEAYEMSDYIKDLINETYEMKDSLIPLYEQRKKPSALEIYKYLPKTNCKMCGELSCMAFAAKLIASTKNIELCTSLFNKDKKDNVQEIRGLLDF
ncbi:Fe-S cluster protein [Dehalobacter sp. DCM]|uniref:(Fe-S)-binding protein n=1 Tax=Dehalobacter sp. DCM TaxID=2907827 RepID=UPI0030815406|nr:Fe-S cluster protein [Dehalobacter sp. DCM]